MIPVPITELEPYIVSNEDDLKYKDVILGELRYMQIEELLEITVDAGYSATLYKVADGKRLGGVGYGADLGYSYFFHKNLFKE